MPQLEKRGKWVFGWVVVRAGKRITVPPEAYREYGFRVGDEIAFTRGSRSSGGFSTGRADKMPSLLKRRVLAQEYMGKKEYKIVSKIIQLWEGRAQLGRFDVCRGYYDRGL